MGIDICWCHHLSRHLNRIFVGNKTENTDYWINSLLQKKNELLVYGNHCFDIIKGDNIERLEQKTGRQLCGFEANINANICNKLVKIII